VTEEKFSIFDCHYISVQNASLENMETDANVTTAAFCTARQQLVIICFNIITK